MSIFCGVHRFAFYYDSLFCYLVAVRQGIMLFGGWVEGGFCMEKTLVGALWWW